MASTSPRVLALVQARLGSTRLPGKALLPLPLAGRQTVLGHVVARARQAKALTEVVVATTDHPADDPLAAVAEALPAAVFRGAEHDVLGRFHAAHQRFGGEVVVRLTADNPAIDPACLDAAVAHHLATGADYTLTTGLPLGTNVEVIAAAALARAHAEARRPEEREHVTPYLRRHPELFRLEVLALPAAPALANLRLTLDYPSDYALLHVLFSSLGRNFGLNEVAKFVAQHPWLNQINGQNAQVQP